MSDNAPAGVPADLSVGSGLWRAVRRSRAAQFGAVILLVFVVVALFGRWLAPYSTTPTQGAIFQSPSAKHPLGTDDAGVDMLSLVLEGARVSLMVGVVSAFVLYPVFTGSGSSYIPVGAGMLVLVLYTVLHPQIRRRRA